MSLTTEEVWRVFKPLCAHLRPNNRRIASLSELVRAADDGAIRIALSDRLVEEQRQLEFAHPGYREL